ncbi:uncharacterized protein EI97DRAFT_18025 [Westerdykella ornata]|uniref:RING-type E3 ubiquitin transferase n=1 Tax=Westerdykella ornata TaxID=318751 RepID=A0A6A6JWL4_WESOR|nr:uncharacterized protein EI97DRAFT_18025 [Westerdykella ornata]KAF2281010.1 hypothetical protein EI97DRAFT_18025 [Westerdykella ornata]
MAAVAGTDNAAAQEPPDPASPRGGRSGGRGRGGPGRTYGDGHSFTPRGRGRGGNRGQGRGNREDGGNRGGARVSEKSLGKAPAATDAQSGSAPATAPLDAEDTDAEVCFICASPIQHTAVTPCNHRTCHICALRLRALYKVKTCAHCRTESDYVIFTDNHTKNYEEFTEKDFFKTFESLGIHVETQDIVVDTELLLRYNCPDSECDVACLGWPDLYRHVQTVHHKKMCDLCTRNKKVFTHEHELFTPAELAKHKKFGDDNPGAVDQSGFKGHPECGFCRIRFYGDDELYTHCRDKHERCHICDRRNEGRQQQYYVDYDALEVHFRKDHFLCPDRECLEKKFVVFDSEIDLKAHQLEVHPGGLSKDALRDARRVDMSGFQLRQTREQETGSRRGRGREGGRGRVRDPNAEPLPVSSAQPLSRAELAFQRQMAIQSSQPGVGRVFGGQLTSAAAPTPSEAFAARPPSSTATPATVTASRPRAAAATASGDGGGETQPAAAAPRTPQEQARLLRHNAVIERASNLLRNDQSKLGEFRAQITAYRTSKVSASQLIDHFFTLFDTNPTELGKLIKELAEIFEVTTKRTDLLKAWSDWKAINEDYPSLPGAAAGLSLGSGPGAHGGSRVLKLKSSTAQSSRSAVNRQASWSTASTSVFPPLGAPSSSSSSRIGAKPGQVAWASSSSAARPSPQPSRASSSAALNQQAKPPANLAEAFPALPAAAKPTTTIFSPGYTGAGLRRDHSGRNVPITNAWTAGSGGGGASSSTAAAAADEAGAGGKKKGNKNKKQTLFHFG